MKDLTPSLQILSDSEISMQQWQLLIDQNIFASPFQTPQFFAFFNAQPGLSAHVFAVKNGEHLTSLCMVTFQKESGLKAWFSRRAIIYGGPLLTPGDYDSARALLSCIQAFYNNKAIYIETRNFFDYSSFAGLFAAAGWKFLPYLNFQIDLQNQTSESLLAAMQYNRKREIRMSLKEEVAYAETGNREELAALYQILEELYKTRVKLPLPSLEYFVEMQKRGVAKVFIVKHGGNVIGGSICPVLPQRGIYTYYYCGLRDYHPKIFPTHIAIWAALEYALYHGLCVFDFMGAGQPQQEYGVRKYKKEFGGQLVEHGRFIRVCSPLLYNLGKWGLKLLAKL